jgi:NAD(P)-dependent dehydrogenase (short-subunit alcohol dehydrogenase family)
MLESIAGKTVLITGASRGIGFALTQRFLDAGARVIATVRSDDAEVRLRTAFGRPTLTLRRCDVTDDLAITALAASVRSDPGGVDVLINNAGVFLDEDRTATANQLSPKTLRETIETNLIGPVAVCRAFAPLLSTGGRIINISSTMGQLDDGLESTAVAYSVSKAALNAYTSALSAALAHRQILVDAMHPGWVRTEMGGADASISAAEATDTAYFLATRDAGESGKFWAQSKIIAW